MRATKSEKFLKEIKQNQVSESFLSEIYKLGVLQTSPTRYIADKVLSPGPGNKHAASTPDGFRNSLRLLDVPSFNEYRCGFNSAKKSEFFGVDREACVNMMEELILELGLRAFIRTLGVVNNGGHEPDVDQILRHLLRRRNGLERIQHKEPASEQNQVDAVMVYYKDIVKKISIKDMKTVGDLRFAASHQFQGFSAHRSGLFSLDLGILLHDDITLSTIINRNSKFKLVRKQEGKLVKLPKMPDPVDPLLRKFMEDLGMERYLGKMHKREITYQSLFHFNESDFYAEISKCIDMPRSHSHKMFQRIGELKNNNKWELLMSYLKSASDATRAIQTMWRSVTVLLAVLFWLVSWLYK